MPTVMATLARDVVATAAMVMAMAMALIAIVIKRARASGRPKSIRSSR
jgi:hypothetical protein